MFGGLEAESGEDGGYVIIGGQNIWWVSSRERRDGGFGDDGYSNDGVNCVFLMLQ